MQPRFGVPHVRATVSESPINDGRALFALFVSFGTEPGDEMLAITPAAIEHCSEVSKLLKIFGRGFAAVHHSTFVEFGIRPTLGFCVSDEHPVLGDDALEEAPAHGCNDSGIGYFVRIDVHHETHDLHDGQTDDRGAECVRGSVDVRHGERDGVAEVRGVTAKSRSDTDFGKYCCRHRT